MVWNYTFDSEKDVLIGAATGILTAHELKTGVVAAIHDPRFHPDIRIFLDYHAVTQLAFSADTMEEMAKHRVYSAKSRRAFLVSSNLHAAFFGYYRAIVDAGRVEVFTDRAKALAWLNEGVPPEKNIT